jgi:hypothetical protein
VRAHEPIRFSNGLLGGGDAYSNEAHQRKTVHLKAMSKCKWWTGGARNQLQRIVHSACSQTLAGTD